MTHPLIYLHFKLEKYPSKKADFGDIICKHAENFVPLHCDSEEPGQEQKRGGTSTLTKRHFKGHEAVI